MQDFLIDAWGPDFFAFRQPGLASQFQILEQGIFLFLRREL